MNLGRFPSAFIRDKSWVLHICVHNIYKRYSRGNLERCDNFVRHVLTLYVDLRTDNKRELSNELTKTRHGHYSSKMFSHKCVLKRHLQFYCNQRPYSHVINVHIPTICISYSLWCIIWGIITIYRLWDLYICGILKKFPLCTYIIHTWAKPCMSGSARIFWKLGVCM